MWWILAGSLAMLRLHRGTAVCLMLIALGWGMIDKVIDFSGLLAIAGIGLICLIVKAGDGFWRGLKPAGEVLLLASAIGLFVHIFPGFNNPKIIDAVKVGQQSAPFSMWFNFDKAIIPFILLMALPTLFYRPSVYRPARWAWLLLILSVPALLLTAVGLGGLRIEAHFPEWLGSFVLANLFFVSLAEEALFRGYLQQRLAGWLGPIPALFVTALLFGLAHIAGGVMLMVFAALTGVIYGLAWMWSGRLWTSTLFHFALNLCQLLLFTYPYYLNS